MKIRALALASALVLAVPAAPAASASTAVLHRHILAACTARGPAASCSAGWWAGDRDSDDLAVSPAVVTILVASGLPGRLAGVRWLISCRSASASGSYLWHYRARTPDIRPVPVPVLRPRACMVTAWAALLPGRQILLQVAYWS